MFVIGKQEEGTSSFSIKAMAKKAIEPLLLNEKLIIADIGCGRGDFAETLKQYAKKLILVDYDPPKSLSDISETFQADLNQMWPIDNESIELLVSLEVIEHLENPRFYFREVYRVLKKGGYAFISTPHSINLIARFLFLLKGQHRYFQNESYPAHITTLLPIDFERLAQESNLSLLSKHYNYHDVLPFFGSDFYIKSPFFSDSIGFLLQKP